MVQYKGQEKRRKAVLKYDALPKDILEQIEFDRANNVKNLYACNEKDAIRRYTSNQALSTLRTPFIRDVDTILNCPFYNRYADKTQVFSFYKNDDITRRSLHVQLVSRIARTIGRALNLNLDLIEAIALGHDLGHSPFGHAGEKILDKIYFSKTSRHFAHNIQSIRVVDKIFNYNLTLQTLDGIAGHNGEIECAEYHPQTLSNFDEFDKKIESTYTDTATLISLSPSTLEGCVVRICDIIAYLGKDRQDGTKTKLKDENTFAKNVIGSINAEIINNLSVNIIKNSYGKNYIKLDEEYFKAMSISKKDNYQSIYLNDETSKCFKEIVEPMMIQVYEKLLDDLINSNHTSPIFTHHINYIQQSHYQRKTEYLSEEPNQIVVDFISSMTDDFFIDLFHKLFPESKLDIKYKGYFD